MVRRNPLGISKIFLIILLLIIAIGTLVIPSFGVWRDTGKILCIMEQFSHLRSLEYAVKNARETGRTYSKFEFRINWCIDCIWFDTYNSRLMIKINEQDSLVDFPIEANFQGIGCDCSSCDQKGGDNYCANLRKDTTYEFEVTADYVKFLWSLDSEGNTEEKPSSQPCLPCVGYDGVCGNVGGDTIPCCFGTECKARPVLWEVNWLGEEIGVSLYSWVGKKCLKSLRGECNDFTECSIFVATNEGHEAQYPCYTIGDDSTTRCCSPLLNEIQTGESSLDNPASDCSKYGGCEVYCGNVKCGYVYNSTLHRSTDMCCKPPGEECWYENWECCALQLFDENIGEAPTQCLQGDGNECTDTSTDCHCCISFGYNCTYETRDYCCGSLNDCLNPSGFKCGEGEECKCSL